MTSPDLERGWCMSVGRLVDKRQGTPEAVERLLRLRNGLPQLFPCEVLAVEKVHTNPAHTGICVRVLLLRGWSADLCALMYKNFRFMHPMLRIDPAMWKVMSRKDLVDELGHGIGMAVADIHCDPGSNPIFEQFLLGLKSDTIVRAGRMCDVVLPCEQGQQVTYELGGNDLPYTLAARIYRDCTGLDPATAFETDLSPLRVDYEELAKAGKALRALDRHW